MARYDLDRNALMAQVQHGADADTLARFTAAFVKLQMLDYASDALSSLSSQFFAVIHERDALLAENKRLRALLPPDA